MNCLCAWYEYCEICTASIKEAQDKFKEMYEKLTPEEKHAYWGKRIYLPRIE